MRVLVQFFHPVFEKSRAHRRLTEAARDREGVTFRDLYELYPDFDIDVSCEQHMLREHDVCVVQHPFFWYSGPPLLKQWLDLVLEHGWAYGREGTALRGKWILHAISAGGGLDAYGPSGGNRHEIGEFLLPFEQTARLCHMRWLPPFCVAGTHRMEEAEFEAAGEAYGRMLDALVADSIDWDDLVRRKFANDWAPKNESAPASAAVKEA